MISTDGKAELVAAIHELTGIPITEEKEYLLDHRLRDILLAHGVPSYREAARMLRQKGDPTFLDQVVDRIATHETSFFRDPLVFTALTSQIIPEILNNKIKNNQAHENLRIWSCACSTGQEPYSLIMQLAEKRPDLVSRTDILATDFGQNTLQRARAGIYTNFEMERGLSPYFRDKYFSRSGNDWVFQNSALKSRIRFEYHNLVDSLYPGPFDIIFCRNVIIYFADDLKKDVMEKLQKSLTADGALVMGGSESPVAYLQTYVVRNFIEGGQRVHYYEINPSHISLFKRPTRNPAQS